jgi:hypothetical protein
MDSLESKLNSIMENPQLMQQIMAMAQNLGGAQEESPPAQPKQEAVPAFGDIDLATIQKISGFARQSSIDKNQLNLIRALGPYLSQNRITRLERAMRAAKVAGLATSFLGQAR